MPPGRKSLDAETKRDHRRVSSAVYEANAVRPRDYECSANSDYHTRRKYRAQAAAHSEQYRDRQAQRERVEKRDIGVVKRRAIQQEADALQASHHAARTVSSTQGPTPPPKKMPRVLPAHSSSSSSQKPFYENLQDSVDSQGSGTPRCRHDLDEPFFPGRIAPRTAIGRPCPGCGLYDCPSKTRDRMLDAYAGASTFTTLTWSSLQDLWALDCDTHGHADTDMPYPPSHLPSPGPLGSLPNEDARRREADFKERLLHSFALNRALPVPTSQEDLGELFTTFLGVSASDIKERMEAWVRSGPPAPGGDLSSLRRRIAEEIEEVLASGSFSSVYMTTPAMAQLSGTFNAQAHTDRCTTQWAEAMAQREGMRQHNGEGSERHWG
ncbi:hypothetical protein K438DRAFT_2000101 [Mycena galopus ATCC 62051]|nr:hypothetical protein K438DRAFT_2000101 [Mycena galopus ATCC 62051]